MDRVKTSQLRIAYKIFGAIALGVLGTLVPYAASADVVFAKPDSNAFSAADQGDYPESHFGAPAGYAVRAVNRMENENSDGVPHETGAGRSPAGLESSSAKNSQSSISRNKISPNQVSAEKVPMTDTNPSLDSASVAARKGVQEISVIAGDLGFFPKTLFVSRDVPVRLFVTSTSKNTLCIMMDSFQVRKQVRSQKIEEITFTPSTPGRYRFYCPVNGMEGTMIVKELASAPPVSNQSANSQAE